MGCIKSLWLVLVCLFFKCFCFSCLCFLFIYYNKSCGMTYPVCGMMRIKQPLLLFGKSSHLAAVGFLSLYMSGPLPYV